MKIRSHSESGSTLICALTAVIIISIIGANVLMNCSARYNATTKQVKGWKEALYAAEAGGDVAFNEIRKIISNPNSQFTGTGWSYSSYTNGPWTYTAPSWFGAENGMNTTVVVDKFTTTSGGDGIFRIRAIGNARVFGLTRTGVDDHQAAGSSFAAGSQARGYGDSLLRKIDFKYDHFIATYGDGDLNGKTLTTVANPQVSRRIELVAVPVMQIDAALKATGTFTGPGAAGVVDSYDSKNGAYKGSNPAAPYDVDAHDGGVSVGTSTFNSPGYIYGNVTTNGGHALPSDCSGVVDNNVPFTVPPQTMPAHPAYQASPGSANFTPIAASSYASGPWYSFSSFTNGVINNPSGTAETYVNVVVSGNISGSLTVAKGVNVRFYMVGNFDMKGKDFDNQNVDGSPANNPSRAGHIQLYGINPTAPATQTIDLNPPRDFYMLIYAPGADVTMHGNPDLYGAVVCHNWSGNGNTSFHFDKQLATEGAPSDYRVASYVEDIR